MQTRSGCTNINLSYLKFAEHPDGCNQNPVLGLDVRKMVHIKISIQALSIIISKNLYYYEKNEYTTNLIRRGKLKFQFQYQIGDKIIAEISSILFLC